MRSGNFNLELKDSQRNGSVINGLGVFGDGINPIWTKGVIPEIEVRWIRLNKGEVKTEPHSHTNIQTLMILIRGHHEVTIRSLDKVSLEKEGDYIFIEPGDEHTWMTKEDTLLMCIRWKV